MDGMLSQDEINALLSGMSIDDGDATQSVVEPGAADESLLSDVEKDAIGEVANISMGTSATTMYSLVNRKTNITTPVVELSNWQTVLDEYEKPCVFILIKYTAGLDGSNILVLKENDVKIITDLMMGGDGTNTDGEIGDLHLSAISEAMNQMMGASATSLSTMLGTMIDISPPDARLTDLSEVSDGSTIAEFLGGTFVKITFRMQIDDLVDSSLMQLYPVDFAKKLVETFMDNQMATGGGGGDAAPAAAPEPAPAPAPAPAPMPQAAPMPDPAAAAPPPMMQPDPNQQMPGYGMPPQGMPYQMPPQGMPYPMPGYGMPMAPGINVQPAQFQNFSSGYGAVPGQENIGLIMDVPLGVTVELGRTTKLISEILDFAPGTIIELDKIAGEPVDVLVNGKFVARGEVVVIEESFGVRVSEIVK
ncbi:MAG: flagellar motor switch phosphatase FliY [Lachnospiraceae bacterium]|nr:flagellar motor switch phosphatase FliY [Lachnospiraceae bacterium]MBR4992974.1 flagellar motor switch phosphatase FliY [Lachnospiraceae bacterium]